LKDHNLSIAPVYLSNSFFNDIPIEMIQLENTKYDKYDIIIQNTLPTLFEKRPGYNIGIYYSDTKNLQKSIFINKINIMDELWVCSESEKESLIKSGVTIPITVIGVGLNIDTLEINKDISPLDIEDLQDKFIFYCIGNYDERQNIGSVIIAYNREFSNDSNVRLIIKTNVNGKIDPTVSNEIQKTIIELKSKLRLYNRMNLYGNEIIICGDITKQQIMSLHKTGHCFVLSAKSECHSNDALEALYFGNNVLCTKDIHVASILKDHCVTVDSTETPIIMTNPPAYFLYNSWETWNEIHILDLQKKMREQYNAWKQGAISQNNNREWLLNNHSYTSISNKIKDRLCQLSGI
jgi:glycosyltransferase involved in cell wall biosynthesis